MELAKELTFYYNDKERTVEVYADIDEDDILEDIFSSIEYFDIGIEYLTKKYGIDENKFNDLYDNDLAKVIDVEQMVDDLDLYDYIISENEGAFESELYEHLEDYIY